MLLSGPRLPDTLGQIHGTFVSRDSFLFARVMKRRDGHKVSQGIRKEKFICRRSFFSPKCSIVLLMFMEKNWTEAEPDAPLCCALHSVIHWLCLLFLTLEEEKSYELFRSFSK